MRVLVFGNSGSGKTTLAQRLAQEHGIPHLDLDCIVWEPGQVAVQRPLESILASLQEFLDAHRDWVIEGCYGELIEAAAPHSTELVFLNPGKDACLENNRARPWEPHKYSSLEKQNEMFDALQSWVSEYYTRTDSWSYDYHRRLFESHRGPKIEFPAAYTVPPK
jgi:adenylate kinase family enzyme